MIACPWCPGERLDDPQHLKTVHRNLYEAARPTVDRCRCGRPLVRGATSAACRFCRIDGSKVGKVRQVSWPASKPSGGLDE